VRRPGALATLHEWALSAQRTSHLIDLRGLQVHCSEGGGVCASDLGTSTAAGAATSSRQNENANQPPVLELLTTSTLRQTVQLPRGQRCVLLWALFMAPYLQAQWRVNMVSCSRCEGFVALAFRPPQLCGLQWQRCARPMRAGRDSV
jgi:hypothetical protein